MIVAAAIYQDGQIWTAKNHASCIANMLAAGISPPIKGEQGFITETGKFLDRHEAGDEAIKSKQITHLRWPGMGLDSSEILGGRNDSNRPVDKVS